MYGAIFQFDEDAIMQTGSGITQSIEARMCWAKAIHTFQQHGSSMVTLLQHYQVLACRNEAGPWLVKNYTELVVLNYYVYIIYVYDLYVCMIQASSNDKLGEPKQKECNPVGNYQHSQPVPPGVSTSIVHHCSTTSSGASESWRTTPPKVAWNWHVHYVLYLRLCSRTLSLALWLPHVVQWCVTASWHPRSWRWEIRWTWTQEDHDLGDVGATNPCLCKKGKIRCYGIIQQLRAALASQEPKKSAANTRSDPPFEQGLAAYLHQVLPRMPGYQTDMDWPYRWVAFADLQDLTSSVSSWRQLVQEHPNFAHPLSLKILVSNR